MVRQIEFHIWKTWEFFFRFFGRVHPLRRHERYLFYIAKRRYFGKPFAVDGITVRRFDPVVELHMNNSFLVDALRDQTSLVALAVRLVQETRKSMPILAERLESPQFKRTQVLYGVTFIHRGVERFGFHILPIQHPFLRRLATWHLTNVFRIVNPNAEQILRDHPGVFQPKMVALSKAHLLSSYGSNSGNSPHNPSIPTHHHAVT